jgi:hypothetical protein
MIYDLIVLQLRTPSRSTDPIEKIISHYLSLVASFEVVVAMVSTKQGRDLPVAQRESQESVLVRQSFLFVTHKNLAPSTSVP